MSRIPAYGVGYPFGRPTLTVVAPAVTFAATWQNSVALTRTWNSTPGLAVVVL